MPSSRITYRPRSDASAEREFDTLATVYRFILDCYAKKEAALLSGPDDAKEIKDVRAKTQYTGQ